MMSGLENQAFTFKSTDRFLIIVSGIIAIAPIVSLLIGILLVIINSNDSVGLGMLLIIISELGIFTIPVFFYYYLPSKNILKIGPNSLELQTYKETISFELDEIKSIKIKFDPASNSSSGGLIDAVVTGTLDAISQSLKGEEEKIKGKFTIEVNSSDKKKKIKFMFVRFGDSFPLINKLSDFTKIDAQKTKYERMWNLSIA